MPRPLAPQTTKLGLFIAGGGYTIVEVADALFGGNRWQVMDHMSGKRRPSTESIVRYCEFFGCDPADIVDADDYKAGA